MEDEVALAEAPLVEAAASEVAVAPLEAEVPDEDFKTKNRLHCNRFLIFIFGLWL